MQKLLTLLHVASAVVYLEDTSENLLQCQRNRPLFVMTSSNMAAAHALQQASSRLHFSDAKWVLLSDFQYRDTQKIDKFFNNTYVSLDCEFLVAHPTGGHHARVDISEVYRISQGTLLQRSFFGVWRQGFGIEGTNESFFERRSDLQGMVLKAAAITEAPVTILKEKNDKLVLDGFFGKVWQVLERRLNFTTDYQVPDDLAWGSLMENDSWNGMIGLIVRNEVHIAVSEFTMTALRATVVDFSVPLINTKNCVLILQDSGENNMLWTRFLDVFSFRLWVMVLFANLVMIVFLKMVNRVKLWCAGRIPTESPDAHFAVYVLGMFCMQGVSMKTQFSSQRMLYLIAQLTAVTVYTAYSAVLISFLTIQKAVLPFNSLRQLIDIGTYKLGVLANSGQLNAFNTATDPLMKEVYTKLIALEKDTLPPTIEAGMQRICDRPKYAFMTSLDVVLGLLDTITCKLTSVLGASIPESLAMSIQQRSPYRALFNYNLNELFRNGILKELRAKEWPTELPGGSIPWTSVSFKDVYPIVIILGTGTVAATFLLFLEMLIRYSQRRTYNNIQTACHYIKLYNRGHTLKNIHK